MVEGKEVRPVGIVKKFLGILGFKIPPWPPEIPNLSAMSILESAEAMQAILRQMSLTYNPSERVDLATRAKLVACQLRDVAYASSTPTPQLPQM